MSKILKIKNKNNFVKNFLQPIIKISESCVLEIKGNELKCLTSSNDNSIILSISYPIDIQSDEILSLNCPDIKKLIKAIDAISDNDLTFTLEENHLHYSDKKISFKYHLLEDGIIKTTKLSLKKLSETEFNTEFLLKSESIKDLIKGSVFSSDSNKIYIHTDDNCVYGELTDKTRNNIDTITLKISDVFEGDPICSIPLNFEIFRIMETSKYVSVKIQLKLGIVLFEIENDYNNVKYVMSSLVK